MTGHPNNTNSGNGKNNRTLIVIGGGAAGFFCAVNAARMDPSLKVIILEKSSKILSKVKVSGGGRCNVTHACFEIPELIRHYPRGKNFLKKSFHWFGPADTVKWFEQRGVQLKEEPDGRMFPVTDNAQTIIDCLIREANQFGVEIRFNTEIKTITKSGELFHFETTAARTLPAADFVCVAAGGYPKAAQFHWIEQLGHTIEEPVPSLFTFNLPSSTIRTLMGVAVENAVIKVSSTKLSSAGPLLITHWGFSGPAVLKLSAWGARELAAKHYDFDITVNWVPLYNETTLPAKLAFFRTALRAQNIHHKNPFGLPQRLWSYLLENGGIPNDLRWSDLTAALAHKLAKSLVANQYAVKGKTTFKEEFVTCGGVSLTEIDANTMQSKRLPGLFFAGEIMDVDGVTGGFNFQHAWTSGWIAAKSIACFK